MRLTHTLGLSLVIAIFIIGLTPISSFCEPGTTIVSFPTNPTNSTSASFSFTSTEENSTFECRIDAEEFSACANPKSYSGLSEGNHIFQVRAVDQTGPDTTPASYSWTVDTTPPETTISSGPADLTFSTSANFVFSSNETGSTFQCRLDEGEFSSCTSPKTYTGLSDGSHTFQVKAVDTAGNTEATPATHSWAIDAATPYVTLNGDWMLTITGSYNDKGAAHFTFDGSKITGYGYAYSLGQVFFIEANSTLTVDLDERQIEGSFNIVSSGTSPTKLGKITIKKGSFNKKFTKVTLTTEFDKEGSIPSIKMNFSGYRFDPDDEDLLEVPEGFTAEASIKGTDVEGRPITVIIEPSSLGSRLGILTGGGFCEYSKLPFELSITDSIFFLTDKGKIYGEFNSNLYSTVMSGKITETKKGPRFSFYPKLTYIKNRATVSGIAEEELPVAPVLVSPANHAVGIPIAPTLSWTPSTDTSITYGLQVSTSQSFSSPTINVSGLTGDSYNATGLTNNRKYYWRMNSTKSGVTSDWSAAFDFTTVTAP